ncbi:hypothetical protein ACFQ3R_09165 [Mesonia ostreae]|uniref:Uncharacterized protein n=1 Tax=Mesonia ostreae TaxID=861110 RepID=A0ABU2KEN5_9FLAO|nr:hypothetical protein [Mesonia ostreae]MDT0293163.1 hypothetical protein [Mesonia ostreae]
MKCRSLLIYVSFLFGFLPILQAQTDNVGINTTNPRTKLEVGGDMNVNGGIQINELNPVGATDKSILLGQQGDGFVKELDAGVEGTAIAYFQEYRLSNMNGDWVLDFNTNINSSEYVVTIISAFFNQGLEMSSNPSNFTIPYISAYVDGGTWHLIADYPSANPVTANQGVWVIRTLILSKDFSKDFPQQVVNMNGTRAGAAATPVID